MMIMSASPGRGGGAGLGRRLCQTRVLKTECGARGETHCCQCALLRREILPRLNDFRKGATVGAMAQHSLMDRGHSRPVDRARDRVRCHSPSPAHEDHERRMADHRTLSSGPRLVALCRHGAANAYEHVYGHACCTRRASILEKRVCLDDTLRRGLRYWRHHRRADRVLGWMDALRRAALCRVFGPVYSRLYFWYSVPIPSHPRHATDFAARGAP